MDKRTLFFVVSLSIALFFVNMFFQSHNQEAIKEQHQQILAKKKEQLGELEQQIAANTLRTTDLPLVELFADAEGKLPLVQGGKIDDTIVTLAWDTELPKNIYFRSYGTKESLKPATLTFTPRIAGNPALYQWGETVTEEKPLRVGALSYFGDFNLQLVSLEEKKPPSLTYAQYDDGKLVFPQETVSTLKKQLEIKTAPEKPQNIGHALAFVDTLEGYLPVGFYTQEDQIFHYLDQMEGLEALTYKPMPKRAAAPGKKVSEEFFVLENNYLQLVFTNYGGSLAEINLPFQTKENQQSVVRQIEFDRNMVENHPYNALFPANPFFTAGDTPTGPYLEHAEGKLGGYYPLLRRDLIQGAGKQSVTVLPKFYGANIVSEYPELAELPYQVKYFDKQRIVFEAKQQNRRITKTYTITEAPYVLDLTIKIEGDSRGLWLTSGVPEVEWISNASQPALKYRITRNEKSEVVNLSLPSEAITSSSEYPDWLCNSNGFFGVIVDPLTKIDAGYRAQYVSGTVVPTRLVEIDQENERFQPQKLPGYMMLLPLASKGGTMKFRIFAGPFADSVLKAVDTAFSDPATGYTPDYIASQSFHGWFSFISAPFAKFLFILLNFFHSITHSWGFSIVLLTLALRIMLYPLNAWSLRSTMKFQQIAPEVQAIQEKHKKDPKKAQLEIMNLYRDKGVNPFTGCFPMLIQLPFLIGMFDLLKSTFALRGAPFIPGWIDNLAAPDVLFSWNTHIPLIGTEFHLLPILLGGVMLLQGRMMSSAPKDASKMSEQQRQQKTMGTMMAVVFTFIFYNFPSGLNIYWLSSMLLGIVQQWWTAKSLKRAEIAEANAQK